MATTHNTSYLGTLSMPADRPGAKTMIDVDHVTMAFNIASEQLNSLKEYAIALSRRELRFKEFLALDDVSFQVKQGDVFGILGTNGSGKSTILKIIAGVLEPTRGTCKVSGSIAPLIELGAGFDLELTARENIFLNGALLGYSKKFIQQHFEEIVDFAEVRDFLDMPMKNYSSGMVARIAFAIATVIVPDVLIVDEVLSVGDFMFQQKCERRIQSLIKDHGVTVLIVSHNNDQIERLCNKAAWIEKGHLRCIGAAQEVSKVYRAIGGRTGSPEAEKTILSLIDTARDVPEELTQYVFGENRYEVPVKLNEYANTPYETVIVTNTDFECSNRIASGLAGALGASVLSSRRDFLPDATLHEIKRRHPRTVIAIGDDTQLTDGILNSIDYGDKPQPECVLIERQVPASGIEAYRLGLNRGEWGDTAVLSAPEESYPIIMLSAYAYSHRAPIFYTDKEGEIPTEVFEALRGFDKILLVDGPTIEIDAELDKALPHSEIIRFSTRDPFEAMETINDWLKCEGSLKSGTAIVTATNNHIDNHYIGSFAGKLNAMLVLEDSQSIDGVAQTIEYLRHNAACIDQMIFLGSEMRFSKLDKTLLGNAVAS